MNNPELDALWAASQVRAGLLPAVGGPTLIEGILNQPSNIAVSAPAPSPPASHVALSLHLGSRDRSDEPVDHAHPLSWMKQAARGTSR